MRIPASLFKDRPAAATMLCLALEQLAHAYRLHGLRLPDPLDRVTRSGSAPGPGTEPALWEVEIPQACVHAVLAILHQTCLALIRQPGPPGARSTALEAFDLLSQVAEPMVVERILAGAGTGADPGGFGDAVLLEGR